MARRLDALVAPLTDAAYDVLTQHRPLDGSRATRKRLADALCAALRAVPRPGVAPDRLDPETLSADATRLVKQAKDPADLRDTIADLLRQVREADQREEWIRQGYSSTTTRLREELATAQTEAADLRHAVRLVKRATRDVRVGRA